MGNVNMNVHVKPYTARVLGVVKEKYGLRNKDQALDKFAEMYGEDFVEPEVKDGVVKDIIRSVEANMKKGIKPMTDRELAKLCGVDPDELQ
ncbi:MAG: hypothetical protein V1835_03585 [Candidatus Micrarchaeota archaeon]